MNKPINIEFVITCRACPWQADAFIKEDSKNNESEDKQVGYLRLRHGYFSVEYPDCGGRLIYEAYPKGDGIFEEDEREYYLEKAKDAIREELIKEYIKNDE